MLGTGTRALASLIGDRPHGMNGVELAPLLMTRLLVNVSGKALLEHQMARSRGWAYSNYVARTSGFFPLPPKRT